VRRLSWSAPRLVVASLVLAAAVFAQKPDSDVLLRAMRDELERSRTLKVLNLEAPYYIEYRVDDVETFSASATLGGLIWSRRQRARVPEFDVRVGSYKFDNTNYAGFRGGSSGGRLPQDDAYDVLRRFLWLGTDGAYKASLEAIARKRAALRNRTQSAVIDDFAPSAGLKRFDEPAKAALAPEEWNRAARSLSGVFAAFPGLRTSSVEIESVRNTRYLVNSEGTELRQPEVLFHLRARASAQAPDGSTVRDAWIYQSRDLEKIPEQEIRQALTRLGNSVEALAKAPLAETYSGPVLFEGLAAAQIFAEVVGKNFAVPRRPVSDPGREGAFTTSDLEGRLGARILPEWIDVVDDPTQTTHNGKRLLGHYVVDREGVAAEPVALVEKGALKRFLLTRQPVRGFSGSNGHARLPGSFGGSTASMSNLFVKASETSPLAELKKKLLEICEARGKPYGMLVRKMDFPSSASLEELRGILSGAGGGRAVSLPIAVYRIYPDGREELVRGLRFRGLNPRSFKDILMAGDDVQVFDFLDSQAPFALLGGAGVVAPTSVIAPSLLIDDLELERIEGQVPNPPLVQPPALVSRSPVP
jgi:TldD protein